MNTFSIPSKKPRLVRLRIVLQIEQVLLFVGVVVYAMLMSVNQRPALSVIMISILTVGNLVIPFAFLSRRIYAGRPFPWNWILFFPVQVVFGFLCAFGSILFLQWTRVDREPFWVIFRQFGYLTIVVVIVANVVMFAVEEVQKKLKNKNQLLEQTVEKGTIALQQQEEELKRAREIQQMLLPNTLPQIPGAQVAGAWQPARWAATTSMWCSWTKSA